MAIERIPIEAFLQRLGQGPLIDVRSPAEYGHAHLPGAVSLPLFSDGERKIVGTLYKQEGREPAIRAGLDFFGPKMRPMVETVASWAGSPGSAPGGPPTVLVYCWRGGMRSAGVSWLLDLYGFRVYTLIGGYKRFRGYVLDTFRTLFPLRLVGGYTGSGKTELLGELRKMGQAVIDLEALAVHRGSAFGNIGLPAQPSQEMFENRLALALRRHSEAPVIWLEDESQRIGDLNIPHELWKTMRRSPLSFLEIPFDQRLAKIVQDYGGLDRTRLLAAIGRIRNRLGGLEADQATRLLEAGDLAGSFRILLTYYDKFYIKGLHNRENLEALLTRVPCDRVEAGNAVRVLHQIR